MRTNIKNRNSNLKIEKRKMTERIDFLVLLNKQFASVAKLFFPKILNTQYHRFWRFENRRMFLKARNLTGKVMDLNAVNRPLPRPRPIIPEVSAKFVCNAGTLINFHQ